MSESNQPINSLQDIHDIRKIMERSSRFISLSGLSGIAAGVWALVGAWVAKSMIGSWVTTEEYGEIAGPRAQHYRYTSSGWWELMGLAAVVFAAAFLSSFYFTWRKSKKEGRSLWDHTTRRLAWNMTIPLVAGGIFILGMLQNDEWRYVAPASLVFYGLALVNASKYTLTDIRYLGYCEIILGLLNMQWVGHGLYFWAAGFGVLHIIYGSIMWWKYERES